MTKPQHSPPIDTCLALSLRKANRVLTQIYDQDLNTHGIKVTQFSVLRAVHYLGETTNRDLQDVLVMDQTTLSRNLKPLLRDGYLEIQPGQDRRQKLIRLSKTGKKLFQDARRDWEDTQKRLKRELGPELVRQLHNLGDAIVELKR